MTDRVSKIKKIKNLNHKFKTRKVVAFCNESEVFANVYSCYVGRTRYFNGKDGFFYTYIKLKVDVGDETIIKDLDVNRVSLEYITQNMQIGFDLQGRVVCRRKSAHGGRHYPLVMLR